MTVQIQTRQALVKCRDCSATIPSLTRGVPSLPFRVQCNVCGSRRAYRPSEVFIACLPRIWKGAA
jgi:Zn finger protein HypA/HybF involved in hydrogenase expression